MELLPKTNIDFIGKAPYAVFFSACLIGLCFYLWFSMGDLKYGVDFKGGHEIVVRVPNQTQTEPIRAAVERSGLADVVVQNFKIGSDEFSIRVSGNQKPEEVKAKITSALAEVSTSPTEIKRSEFVGPTVGGELRRKALIATVLSLLGILLYVAFRFEFAFALGAVVALVHDVLVSVGIYLLAGHAINMGTIAAVLTIIGYSVNDTIVIFDRVREEILKRKHFEIVPIMNEAVNSMLSRTLITGGLTFLSALALLVFGGGAIEDLSLFLVVGVLTGAYSTIYIAAPVVIAWERFRTRKPSRAQSAMST